ncbi:MAG TPA: TonB-dependent receptor [Steroidobacteraceae bacterium]|jgi:outer membrane receptor protein involved in Fe transport
MNSNPKLSYAIAAILGGSALGLNIGAARAAAADTGASDSEGIAEVTVTAQRRSESIQDVPITIQAFSGQQLNTLNVSTMNELLKYTPNVTFSGNGPGTGNIFMRGLSSGGSGNQSQSTTAPFPNVGLYLDDQSMQFPGRNNDVYIVDMERVEVLEGPQGTLFGGGAQAGAIRYITNKPKLGVTEGDTNVGYGVTAGGDPNYNLNATLNLPLGDKLAIRAVVFSDHRGGYIDNVPGTIQVPAIQVPAAPYPPGNPITTNAGITGTNLNTSEIGGARLSLLYQFNDDWNLLIQQNYQNAKTDGYFSTEPVSPNGTVLGQNQISAFAPNFNKDKYESTAWTLDGRFANLFGSFGDLRMVYTGSYMVRHVDAQGDYSNYLTSKHGSYYSCSGAGAGYAYFRSAKPTTCYPAVGAWRDQVENDHQSHEIRFQTSDDNRIRALVGGYWEKFNIKDNMNFNYMPIAQCTPANLAISMAGGPDCVEAVGPVPGYYASDPSLRVGTNTAFGEDVQRGYKQLAFFTSVDFDIIPKVLTITGGLRHYHYDEYEEGSEYYSATSSILNVANGSGYGKPAFYGFGINLHKSESGNKMRGNLTWHITPDILAYYTYSQGFRPGGFNRTGTSIDGSTITYKAVAPFYASSAGIKNSNQFLKPVGYDSDDLLNNEVGFKSEFFEHRLQANLSLYKMDWSHVQLPLFDPSQLGNTTFVVNGPTYEVKGIELQLVARVTEGLTIQGSSSWNSSNQTNTPCLASSGTVNPNGTANAKLANNPTPAGTCITQVNGAQFNNPYGVLNTSPAFSPAVAFNVRARYDWHLVDYAPFIWAGASHIASQRNEPASFPDGNLPTSEGGCLVNGIPNTTLCKYTIPGYTTYDAAIGVAKDKWTAQLTGNNITNSDAVSNISSGQFIKQEFPIRPRVITVEFGYKF